VVTRALGRDFQRPAKMLEFCVRPTRPRVMSGVLRGTIRCSSRKSVDRETETLAELNARAHRAPAGHRGDDIAGGAQRLVKRPISRRSAACRTRQASAHEQERDDRGRRQKFFLTVHARWRGSYHRRGAHQPALAPLAMSARLRCDRGRSRHAFASPERFPNIPLIAEWPTPRGRRSMSTATPRSSH